MHQRLGLESQCESGDHHPSLATRRPALPALLKPLPQQARCRRATLGASAPRQTHSIPTVLVAEDDPAVRTIVTAALHLHGYAVVDACDGEDAVVKLYRHARDISLAFLDLGMPKRSGIEVADLIRSLHLDMPIIITSGFEQRDLGIMEHSHSFLKKPYEIPELIDCVRNALGE